MANTTYYHWSTNAPKLAPHSQADGKPVIFLSKTPFRVFDNHARFGNLYAFSVPKRIEKEAKPHWFDGAQQMLLNEKQLKQCKFLGKVSEAKIQKLVWKANKSRHEVNPQTKMKMPDRNSYRCGPTIYQYQVKWNIQVRSEEKREAQAIIEKEIAKAERRKKKRRQEKTTNKNARNQ